MKKFVLSTLLLLSSLGSSQAANLYASNLGNGITLINGTSAVASGSIRFGVFPEGFDFAATAGNYDLLNAAFVEVVQYNGAFNVAATDGFFQVSATYDANASYDGVAYSTGIAGRQVHVWVLDNTDPEAAVQSAIFATSQSWAEMDAPVLDTFVSPDTGATGLVARLGSLADGNDIGAGAPSHRTSAALNAAVVTRTPSTPNIEVGTAVTFSVNVQGGFNNTFQWRKNGEDIAEATESTYTIPSVGPGDFADYDVKVTSEDITIFSNVVGIAPALPLFRQQPVGQIVALGATLNLSADVVGAGNLRLQWKKGANIAGATSEEISIPEVTLKSAGAYTLVATNTPGAGTGTVTSAKAEVAVVDTTPRTFAVVANKVVKLTASAAGTGITYQWKKDGGDIEGATKNTLSVKVLSAAETGDYVCRITAPAGQLDTGIQKILLVTEQPAFVGAPTTIALPAGTVGGDYSVSVYADYMDQSPAKAPASFKAAKLPAGLKIDALTGVISGRPTKATNGPVTATITVVGSGAAVTVNATISISGFPANLAGSYIASVPAGSVIGDELGGRIDFTVSALGAVSGKILLGGNAAVAFKGAVNAGDLSASIDIIRKTTYLPLTLNFGVNTGSGMLVGATLVQAEDSVSVQGWRNMGSGAAFAGQTNFGLQIPESLEGDPEVPQGVSHGMITVKAPAGTLTIAGRTADGEKITGAAFVGPAGEVVIHNAFYTPFKGSLTGVLDLNRGATAADDTIEGGVTWTRPAATSTKTRLYQAYGFGPLELDPVGGRYEVPATGVILNVAADSQAVLSFEEAGITEVNNPSVVVTLQAKNKVLIPVNPENTTLKVDPKKGAISGGIVQPTNRKSSYLGLAVRTSPTTIDGLGYFLLAQPPVGAEKPTATPVLSGYVSLMAAPGAPAPCELE